MSETTHSITIKLDSQRVWSSNQIFWGAVFGNYLAGFYFLSENYKALGYPLLAKKTILAVIFSGLIVFPIYILLPDELKSRLSFFLFFAEGLFLSGYLINEQSKALFTKSYNLQLFLSCLLIVATAIILPFYLPNEWLIFASSWWMIVLNRAMITLNFARNFQEIHIKQLTENGSKKNSFFRFIGVTRVAMALQMFVFIFINNVCFYL